MPVLVLEVGQRIIPAWAGNTGLALLPPGIIPDHPRVGGEHKYRADLLSKYIGSSPRGRGTRGMLDTGLVSDRIIPAWAGNTSIVPRTTCRQSDHPRVGGEHGVIGAEEYATNGSSPRGRGTRRYRSGGIRHQRIIPAWAGNTRASAFCSTPWAGSSPRGRGTRGRHRAGEILHRIIPAWAGNTFRGITLDETYTDHPRVGGEHTRRAERISIAFGSSPRGRGTRDTDHPQCHGRRIIPAWAGNTPPLPQPLS